MKTNWKKGIDRIAILIALPMAFFGGAYSSKYYAESKAVWVYLTADEEAQLQQAYNALPESEKKMFSSLHKKMWVGFSQKNGIICEGKTGLADNIEKYPISKNALDRALKEDADPHGALVKNKRFGIEYFFDDQISLVPRTSKRCLAAALGALGFAILTILSIGLTTRIIPRAIKLLVRIFRWVKEGFSKQ